MKKLNFNKIVLIVLAVLALAGIAAAIFYYREYRLLKTNPQVASEEEVQSLVAEIGKVMRLPGDETPSLATVLDKEKIKDQPFFQNAENGDKLLAYTKAMKAILYRPSEKKIIEVAPLNLDQPDAAAVSGLKIAYYNGSGVPGRSAEAEKKIKADHADYVTSDLKDASSQDYAKTVVVDVSGTHATEAEAIAKSLGATVSPLPEGEAKPTADILVISGKQ